MPTQSIPRTAAEHAALTARMATTVLDHEIAQAFSFRTVSTLLAISRGVPEIDPADARQLVRAALGVVISAEILTARHASAPVAA